MKATLRILELGCAFFAMMLFLAGDIPRAIYMMSLTIWGAVSND